MEKYIFEGKGYDVPSEHLQVFLENHSGATKYEEPGKPTGSAGVTPTGGPGNMGYNSESGSSEQPEEESNLQQLGNVFQNAWPQLKNAYEGTKIGIVDYARMMGGDDAADFLLGKSDGGIGLIDPDTGEQIGFDHEAYKRDGKRAIENQRYYELVRGEKQPEAIYKKTGKTVGQETDEFIINQFGKIAENKLEFQDTGKGIVGGIKDGNVADVGIGAVNALVSVFTTVAPAILTRGASLVPQIIAPMYTDYNTEKAKALYGDSMSEEEAIAKLVTNNETELGVPVALGLVAVGLEKIGIKGIGKYVASKTFAGKGAATLMMTGNKEGLTEWFQGGVEQVNIGSGRGDSKEDILKNTWDWMTSEDALETYLQGFVGGTGMAGGGRVIQTALRDNKANIKVNEHINALSGLQQARVKSNSPDVRTSIDKKIAKVEESLKNYITTNKNIAKYLTEDQSKELVNILDSKKDLKSKIKKLQEAKNGGAISEQEFELATKDLTVEIAENDARVNEIKREANKVLLGKNLATSQTAIGKIKGLSQKVYGTNEEFLAAINERLKAKGKPSITDASDIDGLIFDGEILINEEVAAEVNAVATGSHELLHGIVKSTLNGNERVIGKDANGRDIKTNLTKEGSSIITDFIQELSTKELNIVQKRIDNNYRYNRDKNGKIISEKKFEEYAEEYLNSYADAAVKGELSDSMLVKVGEFLSKLFGGKGYTKIKFDSGKDVKEFLRNYVKDVKKGEISEKFIKLAGKGGSLPGTTRAQTSKTRGKLVDDISDLQQGATTKADFQKPGTFNKVFESVQPGGAINNYIKSLGMSKEKTQETIDAVTDRLINFDPAAKRKDGTVIGPKGLGEFIMANVGFGKLVAAKKLAVEGEKTKKETSIDTEEAKQIANTTSTTEVEDKSKARNLKDFDIEVEDGLVDAEIAAEIESLLEKNPADIEVQMEKLILGDIRKMLDGIVGKISMNKKTGKREPSPEYNSFVRNEYTEIIQSLGMETIRDAYRPWFEKKKVRTEKYKGISPTTGKPTNYVKDVFENTTNKREYIRWFLEGKPGVLTERRTALLRRIARRKAKIATDNYIEANSKDLGKVAEAKLRKASRAIEDTQNEQKSFDSIRFSKTMDVTSLNQEFGFIQRMTKKVGTKWIGYINPYTNLPQTFVDLGRMYEQAFANHFIKMKIKGLEVISKIASEEGGMADFVMSFNNKIENHEIKASITAFMGSISISSFNLKKGVIKLATDVHNNLLGDIDMVEFTKGYKKRIDFVNKGIEKLNETRPKNKQYDLLSPDVVSGKPQYIPYELYMDKKGFGTKMFYQLKSDERVIQSHYNGKDVHSLSFVGTKFANMSVRLSGKSILNLPMLSADTDINFTFRNSGSKMINGNKMIALSLGVQFKISKLKNNPRTTPDITIKEHAEKALGINFSKSIAGKKLNNAINTSRSANNESKGITVLDFDDTLATTKSNILTTAPDGTKGKMNAEEYASNYEDLAARGYKFDFSEFNKVVKGKKAPLFEKALKLQGKFGPENMFVLTARPPAAQKAIFDFLKANGLNIPMKNITGLANSTSEAKALWIADKVGEGFNDFYFADDALQNVQAVQNMLDQFDVKSKVQQAKLEKHGKFLIDTSTKEGQKLINQIKNIPTVSSSEFKKVGKWNIDTKTKEGQEIVNQLNSIKTISSSEFEKVGHWTIDLTTPEGKKIQQELKNIKTVSSNIKFSKSMNDNFNDILENVTGIESEKRFSDIKARKRGDSKGKFRFFIPPSHEDFVGLLYNFMGKGKEGNAHRDFFEQALVRPLNRAYREIDTAKQAIANDYKALNKQFPNVKDKLIKNTPDGDFTYQDAIRVYLWNKHGYKIPGLTPTDQQGLVDLVTQDSELQAYAETLNVISKQDAYVDPGQSWETGNIRIDLVDATGRVGRKQYFTEFNENAGVMFLPENLNKIEAAYGKDFREALEDMLHRIKTGVNRPKGSSAKPNMFMNWLNASVSGVMFFNTRSALLQQLSNVNFLNFADNNIYTAGKAFANQPQYWKDFAMIFNSDMLKQRRGGIGTDINGAELAEAIKKARPDNMFDQVSIIVGKALKLGFLPTQIGDNIAIATGGAAFYRNRVDTYIKDGLSIKKAESKAFIDLQNITNSTQQSARPDMTSKQQASWIGKIVLNFLNTPSQYNRIIKKAGSDMFNRRITPPNTSQVQSDMSNASRILYYGAAQNLIFYSLQTALFAVMFGSDDEDDDKRTEQFLKKKERVINGTIDTLLRGSGIYGVAVSTLKNMTIKFLEQREKGYNKDESAVIMEMLNFSPVVGIKAREKLSTLKKLLTITKKL